MKSRSTSTRKSTSDFASCARSRRGARRRPLPRSRPRVRLSASWSVHSAEIPRRTRRRGAATARARWPVTRACSRSGSGSASTTTGVRARRSCRPPRGASTKPPAITCRGASSLRRRVADPVVVADVDSGRARDRDRDGQREKERGGDCQHDGGLPRTSTARRGWRRLAVGAHHAPLDARRHRSLHLRAARTTATRSAASRASGPARRGGGGREERRRVARGRSDRAGRGKPPDGGWKLGGGR